MSVKENIEQKGIVFFELLYMILDDYEVHIRVEEGHIVVQLVDEDEEVVKRGKCKHPGQIRNAETISFSVIDAIHSSMLD